MAVFCTKCGCISNSVSIDEYLISQVICTHCSSYLKLVSVPKDYFKKFDQKFLTKEEIVELLI